jgi:hypothetical protein
MLNVFLEGLQARKRHQHHLAPRRGVFIISRQGRDVVSRKVMLHILRGNGKPRSSQAIGVSGIGRPRPGTSNSGESLALHKSAAVVQFRTKEQWSTGCKSFFFKSFAAAVARVFGSAVRAIEGKNTVVTAVVNGSADRNVVSTIVFTSKARKDVWTTAIDSALTCCAELWFLQSQH